LGQHALNPLLIDNTFYGLYGFSLLKQDQGWYALDVAPGNRCGVRVYFHFDHLEAIAIFSGQRLYHR